jgi:hypothetical protein
MSELAERSIEVSISITARFFIQSLNCSENIRCVGFAAPQAVSRHTTNQEIVEQNKVSFRNCSLCLPVHEVEQCCRFHQRPRNDSTWNNALTLEKLAGQTAKS